MKCPNCKRENNDGVKFCKFCGSPIGANYKTCQNGHNYDANLPKCPFCPNVEYEKTRMDTAGNEKTTIDASSRGDKTVIDTSGPTLNPGRSTSGSPDKTVIYIPGAESIGSIQGTNQPIVSQRKLVGWLVTFDINPNGTDYRLYEGRTKIGRGRANDIVISQQGISEEHALILFRDNKFVIEDRLSTNGTFVNSISIEDKITLKDDDVIRIGNINLKLKII